MVDFSDKAEIVAKDLLGKIISFGGKKGRIVETEAYYNEEDPASRACQNGDLRKTMLMGPGTVLVYGVHNNWLLNIVTGREGEAEAVLIRALEPVNFDLDCSGPGKLTKSLGIYKEFHKGRIGKEIKIIGGGGDFEIMESKRVGVREDLGKNLRFFIKNNNYVSR